MLQRNPRASICRRVGWNGGAAITNRQRKHCTLDTYSLALSFCASDLCLGSASKYNCHVCGPLATLNLTYCGICTAKASVTAECLGLRPPGSSRVLLQSRLRLMRMRVAFGPSDHNTARRPSAGELPSGAGQLTEKTAGTSQQPPTTKRS
jgi:hypothetical protein